MHVRSAFSILTAVALLGMAGGCADVIGPDGPQPTGTTKPAPTESAAEKDFPAVTGPADVYHRTTPHPFPGYESRYVLYEDGTFQLQYVTHRRGFFAYTGAYSRSESALTFEFDARNRAGPWKATGILDGSRLEVEYNVVMMLADFVDGVYTLSSAD